MGSAAEAVVRMRVVTTTGVCVWARVCGRKGERADARRIFIMVRFLLECMDSIMKLAAKRTGPGGGTLVEHGCSWHLADWKTHREEGGRCDCQPSELD